ncbi:hypothetical protein [Azospirillum sp. SYSU D00513]|uniref:hypothetical protein n=1 Tax=Azospirillum sp. SYSU D00513 TaxID=2812561 RepID=UPI001A976525|nr:hypothetical protein [Azospirillum sp. SYSU D00513]
MSDVADKLINALVLSVDKQASRFIVETEAGCSVCRCEDGPSPSIGDTIIGNLKNEGRERVHNETTADAFHVTVEAAALGRQEAEKRLMQR